ncbi:oligosaccharide flippase family protein [Aurantibacter sp.]|uniref:oligosaccharide flippase family protein n=1 Tax=Aurantibacter sp. TaxID=2807103 RepID=UPI0035C82DAD
MKKKDLATYFARYKHLSFISLASGINPLLMFLVTYILAIKLKKDSYAIFSSAWIVITILKSVSFFGLRESFLRAYAKNKNKFFELFLALISSSIFYYFICLVFLLVFSIYMSNAAESELYKSFSFFLLSYVFIEISNVIFMIKNKLNLLSINHFLQSFCLLSFLLYISFGKNDFLLTDLSKAIFYSSTATIAISFLLLTNVRQHIKGEIVLKNNLINSKKLIKYGFFFGLGLIFQQFYNLSDQLLYRYFEGDLLILADYSLSYSLISVTFILPAVLYQKYLIPKMIINSESNQDQNWALLKKIIKPTLLISLIITIIFILSINFIEIYVFNNKYNLTFYSILLSPNIIILYLALCYGSILYTKHYYRQKVKYMGITVLINLILNLFFLPLIGIYSLLISTLFSNIYLLISYRKYFYEELQR